MEQARFKGKPRYSPLSNGHWRDNRERILFNRSKYIPGNGAHHRLGKDPRR